VQSIATRRNDAHGACAVESSLPTPGQKFGLSGMGPLMKRIRSRFAYTIMASPRPFILPSLPSLSCHPKEMGRSPQPCGIPRSPTH